MYTEIISTAKAEAHNFFEVAATEEQKLAFLFFIFFMACSVTLEELIKYRKTLAFSAQFQYM